MNPAGNGRRRTSPARTRTAPHTGLQGSRVRLATTLLLASVVPLVLSLVIRVVAL